MTYDKTLGKRIGARFGKYLGKLIAVAAVAAVATVQLGTQPQATAQEKVSTEKTYYLGTHTKHTNVSFVSEADIETIYGTTNVVNGQTVLDFEKGTGKTRVRVPVKDLKTGIAARDEHLQNDKWLDAKKYPEISFRTAGLKVVDKKKGTWKAKGKLTIKDVTKDVDVSVRIRKIPEKLWKKLGKGEWIKVTTSFDVKITDFNVKIPDGVGPKVSDTWTIKFQVYASTKK